MSCSHAARLQKEYGLFGKLQQKPWTDLEKLFFYLHNFLEEVGNKLTALLKLRWPLGRELGWGDFTTSFIIVS